MYCAKFDSSYDHILLSADDLRDYFEKFGTISDATVKTDPTTGRSKGFGFVVFMDPSAVDQVTLVEFGQFQPVAVMILMHESGVGFSVPLDTLIGHFGTD